MSYVKVYAGVGRHILCVCVCVCVCLCLCVCVCVYRCVHSSRVVLVVEELPVGLYFDSLSSLPQDDGLLVGVLE